MAAELTNFPQKANTCRHFAAESSKRRSLPLLGYSTAGLGVRFHCN